MLELRLATACLAAVCAHGCFSGAKLALSVLALKSSQAPALLGVVMMAAAVLPALLSPRIGRLVDRHGVRRMLHACLGGLTLAALALWRLPAHLLVLVGAAALLGLSFNAFAVSIQKLIGGLPATPRQQGLAPAERRKQNFGTLATATSVSAFAGPLLAGWGMDHLPSGAVFLVLGLPPLAAWLLSLAWCLPPPTLPAGPPVQTSASQRPLMLERPMLPLAGAIVLLTLSADVLIFLSPVIGQRQGLSATVVGGIVSAAAVGGFVVRLASGLFIARLHEWGYIRFTLLACAALLLLCTQATSAPALLLLSFLMGALLGLAQPMTQSLLHQAVPEARVGEALGARLALVGGAQAAAPLLLGLGAQHLGAASTLAIAALVLGAGGVAAVRAACSGSAPPRA